MRSALFSAAAILAAAQLATAQTSTLCDPTKKTCPSDPALGKTITVDFTQGASKDFSPVPGTTINYGADGAEFTITNEGMAPTMDSNWYIFFGHVEVVMKAAPGQGIVSSFVLESDDLDEVDWEWLGGDKTQVQSNYFGKGDTTTYDRGGFHSVNDPQDTFHTYALDWNSATLTWSIDGAVVRTLNYGDAQGGTRYPQTPMKVKIGSWDGGASTEPPGTVEWAGGPSNFDNNAAYTMVVKSVTITDAQGGAGSYSYGDMSGSWQSIKISKGDGQQLDQQSSSSSSTAAPSSSSSSVKPSSTSSSKKSSSTSSSQSSTMTTMASSSTAPSSTEAPTSTSDQSSQTTSAAPSSTTSKGAAATLGANLAMVGAAIAFFAL